MEERLKERFEVIHQQYGELKSKQKTELHPINEVLDILTYRKRHKHKYERMSKDSVKILQFLLHNNEILDQLIGYIHEEKLFIKQSHKTEFNEFLKEASSTFAERLD